MQDTSSSNNRKIIKSKNVKYTLDEICPCCGRYTSDGDVCTNCQKYHGIYKSEVQYIEH